MAGRGRANPSCASAILMWRATLALALVERERRCPCRRSEMLASEVEGGGTGSTEDVVRGDLVRVRRLTSRASVRRHPYASRPSCPRCKFGDDVGAYDRPSSAVDY
ncbi:hypothetical protein C8Q78DRAFT_1004478 [Trametes maxima]|nr:hypothetical protein C8Q78DRAFT_1004478 [Trametes maxima]